VANTWIQPSIVAKEALRQLENNLVMGRLVHRGYEDEWQQMSRGWKIGSTVTLKTPVYFRVKNGASMDEVELREEDTSIVINARKHVAWAVTSQQMTLDIDKFSKRFIQPAMQALANHIDSTLLGLYTDVPNQVGTPGTTPNNVYTFLQAQARLTEEACPDDNRHCVIDPQCQAKIADTYKALFHQAIVGSAVRKGSLGNMLGGFNMYTSNNVSTHTNGTAMSGLTIQCDGSSSEGDTTLAIKSGGSSETFKHGDIFTIAAVNAVNPISGADTGSSRQFVVDAAASMDGSGEVAALTCTPGTAPHQIYATGAGEKALPYQNVSAVPLADAVITPVGTTGEQYKTNLAFHGDAFALCMVPLAMPLSVSWGAQESYKGFTIRVVRDYTISSDTEYIRFDILYGVKTINPFLACRIAGA